MAHINFFLRFRDGQTIIEFSLLIVITVIAFIAMQPLIKRAMEGRLRSSADEMGDQFSPRWSNIRRQNIVHYSANENTTFGNLTRTTERSFFSDEHRETADIWQESAEIRNYN